MKIKSYNPLTITQIQEGQLKKGYMYDNRAFFSYQEVLCYQYLQEIGIPAKKMHMEYRVGRKHFDFFPLRRVFWEHHPILRKLGEDLTEYAIERREILDSNGYDRIPLIVSGCMFTGIDDIRKKMHTHRIDFRKGIVPSLTQIIGYEELCEKIPVELLAEPLLF